MGDIKKSKIQPINHLAPETTDKSLSQNPRPSTSTNTDLGTLSTMAAALAHEINNPLSGIKNCVDLLRHHVPESHKDQRFVNILIREIDRLSRVVHQMCDLGAPPSDSYQFTNPYDLICDVLDLHSSSAKNLGITLTGPDRPHSPIQYKIAGDILQQVLHNLVKNALDAMADSHGEVAVFYSDEGDHLRITVRDHGPGIPHDSLDRIFELFYSTKEKGHSPGRGLGLGLAISRDLITSIGGSLTAENNHTKGSSFVVKIPHQTT